VDIEASFAQLTCLALGVGLGEVAFVADTACERKAPFLRLHRELRCSENIPDDVRALEVGVAAVAVVLRQSKRAAREITDFHHALELALPFRPGSCTGAHPRERPGLA